MPKINHAKRLMEALQKFDHKDAERVLDILAEDEEKGHEITNEEQKLRGRLEKCLDAYNRTASTLERG